MAQSKPAVTRQNRAYTLVEMMVVMVILIVVMALVAPVIGNARNAAKKTNTRQLLNNLAQASQQFEIDNRTTPGYFSPAEMGHSDNLTRGFSETNNVLLDLAGGRVEAANPPLDSMEVGPTNAATTRIRAALIGAPVQTKGVVNKGYFTPDPKYFVLQPAGTKVSINQHLSLPDVIDGFGQPILAWRQDLQPSPNNPDFATETSAARASFYWASNAPFLQSTRLGKKEQDQEAGPNPSLLAESFAGARFGTMAGMLGNPAFPGVTTGGIDVPAASRGKLIFHSAGNDGVYLGSRDRGGLIAGRNSESGHVLNTVDYRNGKDPMEDFDDVFSVAGN